MDKRKSQCYVCGQMFDSLEKFKEHILESHEEGREYVICPLKRCQWPVRDLRAHFKFKHPYDKLPKNCQIKPLVWFDFSNPKKKRKVPTFKEGSIISAKNEGKVLKYRSGYEHEVYNCLEKYDIVKRYEVEPFGVPYFWKGKNRTYYPDIRVLYEDGRIEVWEIKPANQTKLEQNIAKWNACRYYCDFVYIFITEHSIILFGKIGRGEHGLFAKPRSVVFIFRIF